MNFERHDEAIAHITRLTDAGCYGEARELAAVRLAECRRDWGYDGRNETQRSYLKQFNRLRAHAARKEQGVIP